MTVVVTALVVAGLFFLLVSTLGLLRLPDFYARTHAAAKSETLGGILILAASAIHASGAIESFKLLLILFLVGITSPIAVHALTRAAVRSGVGVWVPGGRRDPGASGSGGGSGRQAEGARSQEGDVARAAPDAAGEGP